MRISKKLLSSAVALTLLLSTIAIGFNANAETVFAQANKIDRFSFSELTKADELEEAFKDKVQVMHNDATLSLNDDKTVTLTKGKTACAGLALNGDSDREIESLNGKIYLAEYALQSGVGFIHSKTTNEVTGAVSYKATTYCLGLDPIGGVYLARDRGSVDVNADGMPYKGVNNNGGTWGGVSLSYFLTKQSQKTTTTVETYTQCTAESTYSATVEYYTKDDSNKFTKHAKGSVDAESFNANPTDYYVYSAKSTNQFNLENAPEDCSDVMSVSGNTYTFTSIKTEKGYFNQSGVKSSGLGNLGIDDETIAKLAEVEEITDADRAVDYTLRYVGEDVRTPVLTMSLNIGSIKVKTKEMSVPVYSSDNGKEKSLGLAVVNSWARNDKYKLLKFGDFEATYIVDKQARTLNLDKDVRYIARHYKDGDKHCFGWEQSGFEFSFVGTGATIKVTNNIPKNRTSVSRGFMNVYVDGVRQSYVNPPYEPNNDLFLPEKVAQNTFVVAHDLPEGTHTIKVIKRSGASHNTITLDDIYIHQSDNAVINQKPAAPERRVAVIGDSITEGMGILSGGGLPSNEDPTLTYATLSAEALGAEVSDAMAEGGLGVTLCNKDYTAEEIYDYVDYHNLGETVKYDFDTNPDAIIFNLGTNDGSSWEKTTPEEFKAGLKSLINKIREKYPNKPIFYVYGMMAIGDKVTPSIREVLTDFKNDGVDNIYFVPVSCTTQNGEITYASHPNALGHARVSKHLIAKMSEVLGWETEDMKKGISIEDISDIQYDKSAKTPELTVKAEGKLLTENDDYIVSYENNVNIGTATAKITLCGNYSGYAEKSFNIICNHSGTVFTETKKPTCAENGLKEGDCPICGNLVKIDIQKTNDHKWNETKTVEKEPTCTTAGESSIRCSVCDAVKPDSTKEIPMTGHKSGKETIERAGIGKNGKAVAYCSVCKAAVTSRTIYAVKTTTLSSYNVTYNNKVQSPKVTVKDSKGKSLKLNRDYKVTYQKGRKSVGRYSVKITLIGNYSGSRTLYFNIVPKGTKLKTVSAGKKKLTVKWSKQTSQTSGYQLQYSTSSKFSKAKTVTVSKNKTTAKTIGKLTAKKKYYVRIRTYKTVGKTKLYSGWSAKKSVTVKK